MFSEISLMMLVQITTDIEKTATDIILGCNSHTVCRDQQERHAIFNVTGDYSRTPRAI